MTNTQVTATQVTATQVTATQVTATQVTDLGLRERKRIATHRAIQLAVLTLVAERGNEGVTIDEISRVADISPRTFFNYFATKEEALQGETPTLADVSRGQVDRFIAGADGLDVLDGLELLLIEASQSNVHDLELVQLRHSVLKRFPQLFASRIVAMRSFEEEIAGIVRQRLAGEPPATSMDDPTIVSRARLVTLVAFAGLRHAWARWAAADAQAEASLSTEITHSFRELKSLFAAPTA